jgi:hypothetical protein
MPRVHPFCARRAGWPWRLPARAPTDRYVLILEHTVLQPTDSPSPKGPRSCSPEYLGHADEPRCVQHVSLGRAGRRFASLHRVLRGEFPCFIGTIKALRLPAAHPSALRCLRLAIPPRSLVLFATRRTSAPPRPGVGKPVSPAGSSLRKRQDLPGSWGTPSVRSLMFSRRRQDCSDETITVQQRGPWYPKSKGSHERSFGAQ